MLSINSEKSTDVYHSLDKSSNKNPIFVHISSDKSRTLRYRSSKIRWLALFFICSTLFGSYYCCDNPQALQSNIISQIGIDLLQYNLLYSVYSFPNILLPLIGGVAIDNVGARIGTFYCTLFVVIGQGMFFLGCLVKSYPLMVIARAIFGIGSETLGIARAKMLSKWFSKEEFAYVLSWTLTVSRLASTLNSFGTPFFFEFGGESLGFATAVGLTSTLYSFFCGLGLIYIDKVAENDDLKYDMSNQPVEKSRIRVGDIMSFSLLAWLVVINFALGISSLFSFLMIGNDFIHNQFSFSNVESGTLLSVIYISSGLFAPVVGKYVSSHGKRLNAIIFAYLVYLCGYGTILYLPHCERCFDILIPLGCFAIFMTIFPTSIWSCVPLAVEPKLLGTVFGVIACFCNIGGTINPIFVGWIANSTKNIGNGYFWSIIFLAGLAGFSFVEALILAFTDQRKGKILNL